MRTGAVTHFEQVFALGKAGQGRHPEVGGEDGALGVFRGWYLVVQDVERGVVVRPLVLQGVLIDPFEQAPVAAARDLAHPAPGLDGANAAVHEAQDLHRGGLVPERAGIPLPGQVLEPFGPDVAVGRGHLGLDGVAVGMDARLQPLFEQVHASGPWLHREHRTGPLAVQQIIVEHRIPFIGGPRSPHFYAHYMIWTIAQ